MNPEQWRQAKHIFEQALDRAPGAREAFVRETCGENRELFEEVASLLASHEEAGDVFLSPLIETTDGADRFEGRQLGPYRILHRLGHGGMGAVYLAERADEQFRRRVAVKLVRPGYDDGHLLRRFSNERQMLAVLDHPYIVKLLDAGNTEDGIPYFVMDYVEGQPIDEFCRTRGLSVPELLVLFREVCAAVHYAHRNLVVHRDLKPSNILVTTDGTPKLLDFGIAKLLRPEYGAGAIGLTRTLQPMTPEYASPEQVMGQPITTSSDVYSLGVLLYRLIAGRHPYEMSTSSAAEMERIVCETNPERPSAATKPEGGRRRLVASDIDNIVLMAMRKEPQRRYPSAEHLSEDIRRYLANEPVTARPDTLLYRTGKFVRRNRIGVGASVLGVVALIATGVEILRLKSVAETRFADLRHSASFMLFDLDDELRKSPTAARKLLVSEAVGNFDRMAQDAGRDEELKFDVSFGYHKIGEIQGNPARPNLGDFKGARKSYTKELEMATSMKPGPKAAISIARGHVDLGRLDEIGGSRAEALQHFQTARQFYQAAGDSALAKQGLLNVEQELGELQEARGDIQAASQYYAKSLEYAQELERANPTDVTRRALHAESFIVAFAMARAGRIEEALTTVREALRIARELAATNDRSRRDVAADAGLLGYILHRTGRAEAAIGPYQESIGVFEKLAEDPKDQRARIDLGQTKGEMADVLWATNRRREASEATQKALGILEPIVDSSRADPYVLASYARFLLAPSNARRDDARALRCAQRADSAEKPSNPDTQEILAAAYAATHDPANAHATAKKALDSLPPGADAVLRKKLEGWLSWSPATPTR
jgi:serine/threonine protein kinase